MSKSKQNKLYKTPVFRLHWEALFEPEENENDDGTKTEKYSLVAIFDEKPTELYNAAVNALKEKFGLDGAKLKAAIADGAIKFPFKSNALKSDYPGYEEGGYHVRISSKKKPRVVRQVGAGWEDIDSGSGIIFNGCYCRCSCDLYTYSNKGKGAAFGLYNVMWVRTGDLLGGGASDPEDDFAEFMETVSEDELLDEVDAKAKPDSGDDFDDFEDDFA